MITELTIRNFKSVRETALNCSKINVFIGEPNTGKSNILEAFALLRLFSNPSLYSDVDLRFIFRISDWRQLFYWQDLTRVLTIDIMEGNDRTGLKLKYEGNYIKVLGDFTIAGYENSLPVNYFGPPASTYLDKVKGLERFAFYRFRVRDVFNNLENRFVVPPDAPNLVELLRVRKELRREVVSLLGKYGYRLIIEPSTGTIRVERSVDEDSLVVVSLHYSTVSDTLQRTIFNLALITCNENMVIAFEEPEAHTFPYYVKYLAEKIAMDERGNQFFISTHNPYFLLSVLEKAPRDDVNVFVTSFENYETKVRQLPDEHKEKLLDYGADVFFNLDNILEELSQVKGV